MGRELRLTRMSWHSRPGAPPPGTILCRADEIAEAAARVFSFGGGARRFEMFVLCWKGALVAYVNECPHALSPLDWTPGQFLNSSRTLIVCWNHGALFRPSDGLCVSQPCPGARLTPVPIEVIDGEVVVGED